MIGIGRIGSAIAPLLAGLLFAEELGREIVSATFAALAIGAGLLLATSSSPSRNEAANPVTKA